MMLRRIASDIFDIAWPHACLGCGNRMPADNDELVCQVCLTQIPRADCYKKDENFVTNEFVTQQTKIEYGCCYFHFKKGDWTQNLMHNIKYFKRKDLASNLGRIAATELKTYNRFTGADVIVPVPMHDDKIHDRGFNQAERIAIGLSEVYGIPIREDVLTKTVNSRTQTYMVKAERIKNAERIFQVNRVEELSDKHILLVDDVITTGTTLLVCTQKILRAMPGCRVSVFALARA